MNDEYLVEKVEQNGLTGRIYYETGELFSPRDFDNLSILTCWHPDYLLGDEQVKAPNGRGYVENPAPRAHDFKSLDVLHRYLRLARGALIVLPLYLYDHSGITMSVGQAGDYPFDSAGWDSTDVGFAWTNEERVAELCGDGEQYRQTDWLDEQIRADVKLYDAYLRGESYGYVVENEEGEHVDSCWGFVGDEEGCKAEMMMTIRSSGADETYVDAAPVEYALAGVRA